jgi:hypothetical protein
VAPIVAAFIIGYCGGIGAESIRLLYWIAFVAEVVLLVFMLTQMNEVYRPRTEKTTREFSIV